HRRSPALTQQPPPAPSLARRGVSSPTPLLSEEGQGVVSALALLLARRLRRPQLNAACKCRRGVGVKVNHCFGDVLAGKLPTFVGPAARYSPEIRIHASGHDVAYANAVIAHVLHHGLAEPIQPKFGSIIGAPTGERIHAGKTGNVEDVSAPSLAHYWDGLAAA